MSAALSLRARVTTATLDGIENCRRDRSNCRYFLLITARIQLGRSFSVSPQAKELVTHGLYSRIRNPIYVSVVVMWLGLIVALHLYWLILPFLVMLFVQVFRSGQEARALREKFGQTLGLYRDCPVDEAGLSPVNSDGAVSIETFELSLWRLRRMR